MKLTLSAVIVVLASLLLWTLKPYGGNPSALFHLDRSIADVPAQFIVLTVPGYDGMQYFRIAKTLPQFVTQPATIAYSYQRILLPVLAWLIAFGQTTFLPWSFLLINLAALVISCITALKYFPKQRVAAAAIALSPAGLIGLHFSLAEPLTLALLTAFLCRFLTTKKTRAFDVGLLSLLCLAREVNVLFVLLLTVWLLWQKQYRSALLMLIPLAVFFCLHLLIFQIFHEVPFLWSTGKNTLPFQEIVALLSGQHGYNLLTLSSIALIIGFVLPALVWAAKTSWQTRGQSFAPLAALAFLLLMCMMPDHIWGSITSIGRVITPVYPLVLLGGALHDNRLSRTIRWSTLALGCIAGFGLASIVHPFLLSPL